MKKMKSTVKPFRVSLPKQRNQAFKKKTEYNKKDKSWKKDSGSFCFFSLDKLLIVCYPWNKEITMKRKIVCEIDVPEDYDMCWQEPSGIQAFHDVVICHIVEYNTYELSDILKYEKGTDDEKRFAKYLRLKLNIRRGLKVVGYVNEKNELIEYKGY